jgi:hypothetical protein
LSINCCKNGDEVAPNVTEADIQAVDPWRFIERNCRPTVLLSWLVKRPCMQILTESGPTITESIELPHCTAHFRFSFSLACWCPGIPYLLPRVRILT